MSMRFWSWVFLAAAAALLLASGWFARHPFTVLTQWKTTEGGLLQSEVIRDHDSDAAVRRMQRHVHAYAEAVREVEKRTAVKVD